MSNVPAWRFIALNLIGAAIWAPLFVGAGFLFGQTLEWVFTDIKRYEEAAFLMIIATALTLLLIRRLRRRG
jgi:membrane protein DedA with SNARE-associated domain